MIIIENDEENQLRSGDLRERLQNKSLSHCSIELYLRCPNPTAIGLLLPQPEGNTFSMCPSLLRVDLSGCPKLEGIPNAAFGNCYYLVSVVFGEHSKIAYLGKAAFHLCSALTSITVPNNLKVIEELAFGGCTSLKRVVCNKNL